MKYYGKIEDNNDLVNKKYVDDNSGSIPNDGKLKINVNSENPIDLFTANQSNDSTLKFIGTNGIDISTSTLDNKETSITISGPGNVGNPGNGTLYIQTNSSDDSTSLFTANQSTNTDSTLNFIGASGITISKTHSDSRSTNITISGNGGGTSSNSYYKYSQNTTTTALSIPTSYKNVVVKFYYSNISTPGSGGVSYTLNFANRLNEGSEMYIYLRNVGDTSGVNIQVPTSLSFSESSSFSGEESTTYTYPVVYNGYYTGNTTYHNETINLVYNPGNKDGIIYTALVLHVFFDGEVYYINKLQYTLPNN